VPNLKESLAGNCEAFLVYSLFPEQDTFKPFPTVQRYPMK